jgi:hypothetical protein
MCPQVCECEVVFWSIKLPYLMQSVFKLHPEFDFVVAEVRHGQHCMHFSPQQCV